MTKLDMNCNGIEEAIKKVLNADGQQVTKVKVVSWESCTQGDLVFAILYYGHEKVLNISFYIYFDGSYFTPFDWESYQPTRMNEVTDVDWQWGCSGKKAVIIGRAPTMLFGEDS